MKPRWWWVVPALLGVTGCGSGPRAGAGRVPLTERQRDSVIARSSLPGASVMERALAVSDQAAAHAAREDSLTR